MITISCLTVLASWRLMTWEYCRLVNIYHRQSDNPDNNHNTDSELHNCIRPGVNSTEGNWGEYNQEDYSPLDYFVGDPWIVGMHLK